MNMTAGHVIGEGIGPDEKWVLRSRKILAALLLLAEAAGVGVSKLPMLEGFGEALVALVSAGLVLWSTWRPDGAKLTALPKTPGSGGLVGLIVCVMLACASMNIGDSAIQKFYKADEAAISALEVAADVLTELELQPTVKQREAVLASTASLRIVRQEARDWVKLCSETAGGCETSSMVPAWTSAINELVNTVNEAVEEIRRNG